MKISSKQYAEFIFEIEKQPQEDWEVLIKKMAVFIKNNRDAKKMDQIEKDFKGLRDEKESIKRVKAISREELGIELKKEIKNYFAGEFNVPEDKIILENEIDVKLMGGIIIKIGDEVWDGSIISKLNRVQQVITK